MTEQTDSWPTPDGETVVVNRTRDTVVGAPPPPVAPGPPPAAGPPPDRRIGTGMLLGLGALLLVAAGIAIAWFLTHRDSKTQVTTVVVHTNPAATAKVAVPRVVGLKEQDALARLAQVGLRPKEVFKPTKQSNGLVVSQKPVEAKQVAKGSQVTLVIDQGAAKVAVPDVTGKSVSDAQAALDKLGLDSTTTQVTSTEPAGTVVDMAPKSGAQLAKGSTVTLSVAKQAQQQTTTAATTTTAAATTPAQPQNATVPDVSGQTEASATQAFWQAGVIPSLAFVPGTDTLGTVAAQAKPSGTTVPYHSHVQLNVSSGPGTKTAEHVPNVVGQTMQQAISSLNGAHLRLIYLRFPVTSQSQVGKIVQQTPLGGGSAPQNAQVLVFLGTLQRQ